MKCGKNGSESPLKKIYKSDKKNENRKQIFLS